MRRFLVALLLLASLAARADVDVLVGGRGIRLADPPDLVALKNTQGRYYRFAADLQSRSNNRLVAAFLQKAEARSADTGGVPDPATWAIAWTVPTLEGELPASTYKGQVQAAIESEMAKAIGDKDNQRRMEEALTAGTDKLVKEAGGKGKVEVKLGQMQPLGVYAKTANTLVYGIAMNMNASAGGAKVVDKKVIAMVNAMHVRGRIVFLGYYRLLADRGDIAMAREKMVAWAEAIARANP